MAEVMKASVHQMVTAIMTDDPDQGLARHVVIVIMIMIVAVVQIVMIVEDVDEEAEVSVITVPVHSATMIVSFHHPDLNGLTLIVRFQKIISRCTHAHCLLVESSMLVFRVKKGPADYDCSCTDEELRTLFSRAGVVQTCITSAQKRHAFVKVGSLSNGRLWQSY